MGRHQAEIRQRSQDWAKAAEGYYWELGTDGEREGNIHAVNNIVPMRRNRRNQEKALDAQARIQQAVQALAALGQLLDDLSKRGEAIVITARCSKQTLYKYQELWLPKYDSQNLEVSPGLVAAIAPSGTGNEPGNSQSCVQADPEPPLAKIGSPTSDIKKPLESKLGQRVHATPYMKGRGVEPSSVHSQNLSPAAFGGFSPDPSPILQVPGVDAGGLSPDGEMESEATIAAIRSKIRQLGWQPVQFQQFVSERYGGKRWSQLTEDDRLLLLYWLQGME